MMMRLIVLISVLTVIIGKHGAFVLHHHCQASSRPLDNTDPIRKCGNNVRRTSILMTRSSLPWRPPTPLNEIWRRRQLDRQGMKLKVSDDDDNDDQSGIAESSNNRNSNRPLSSSSSFIDPRNVAKAIQPSVALVTPMGVRNMTARGSGFVIDVNQSYERDEDDCDKSKNDENKIYLLTAAHVAAPGHRLEVTFPHSSTGAEHNMSNLTSYSAKVIGRNPDKDLALLCIEYKNDPGSFHKGDKESTQQPPPPPPLPLADDGSNRQIGTPVFCFGYPSGGVVGVAMTSGIVCASAQGTMTTNTRKDESDNSHKTRFVVTNAAMAGGMSGGPLVDIDGNVIGVNALVNMELRALGNYAVDISESSTLLSDAEEENNEVDGTSKNKNMRGKDTNDGVATYRIYLYNDRFNKRERVSKILKDIVNLDNETANKLMMEAHSEGRSIIKEFATPSDGVGKEDYENDAYQLCETLRQQDILVEVEKTL